MTRFQTLMLLLWCLAGPTLLAACAATEDEPVKAKNEQGAEMIKPVDLGPPPVYRFYPGDQLSIAAVNRPELAVTAQVDPYGYIAYPYLGQVNVRNLSAQEVAERLSRGLEQGGYYTRPMLRVSLVATKEQFIYVLGEVKKPGPVPVIGSVTMVEALGRAGGHTYDAEMSTVLWIRSRQAPPGVVKIDMRALGDPRAGDPRIPNLPLHSGDVLFVPDSVIVSVERFMIRMFNIIRPVVELERGIVLYPDVADALRGDTSSSRTITISNTPFPP